MIDQVNRGAAGLNAAVMRNVTPAGRLEPVAPANEDNVKRRASSRLDKICNLAILAIIALPFLLGFGAFVRRLAGN